MRANDGMNAKRKFLVALLLLAVPALPVTAEEVEKKFRVWFGGGFLNAQDEVRSEASNVLVLLDRERELDGAFIDPRNDSSVFGTLEIQSGPLFTIGAQYAVTKIFLVEASVGYHTATVGDVEVQAQFGGVDIDERIDFNFQTFRIEVGELTRVPVQVTAIVRFRPRSGFNPYLGMGLGYSFIGFEPSAEFNQLSRNMDRSRGGLAFLTDATEGTPELSSVTSSSEIRDLDGATVSAPDTFEWHLAAGAELTVKKKWALFLDVRYTFASRSLSVGFDGGNGVGVGVPQLTDFADSLVGAQVFGALQVTEGGLIDGGSTQVRPIPNAPFQGGIDPELDPEMYCQVNPLSCVEFFDLTRPDGEPDTGFYYAQDGEVRYGAFGMLFGFRYTF